MIAALLAGAALAGGVHLDPSPVTTLITGARVLDERGHVGEPSDVLLEGGRIARIDPMGAGWGVDADRIVDGRGATLMPGLVDVHVHVGSGAALPGRVRVPRVRENLDALLAAGVTTVLDPGWSRDAADRWAGRVASGRVAGPRIYAAGRPFGAPDGHPRSTVRAAFPGLLVRLGTRGLAWEVREPDDVDAAIAAQGQTDVVKVMLDALVPGDPVISDPALQRVRTAATALGVPLVAHVGRPEDVDRALALPVDALIHAPWAGRLRPDQADALRDRGIPVAPTLAVWDAAARTWDRDPALDELTVSLQPRKVRRDTERLVDGRLDLGGDLAPWLEAVAAGSDDRRANAALLHEHGVSLLVGSDTPTFWLPAGAGTHRELHLLHQAGVSAADVLVAATWTNSRFLDPGARFGAVRAGYEADLLLVDGDPTQDLSAIGNIRGVWVDGRRVERR